jgi:zinc protease
MPGFARLILAAALAGTPLGVSALSAATPRSTAIRPLAFTERTLANGLKVYAIRDASSPNVSVQVWYDVGSKDDPRGRSGFAHLFEHMMFKATRNMAPEQMDRLTEDVGGFNNASTWDDFTNYYETVPANHLRRLLWAEADRMGSLVVDQPNFLSEREVVKEELRTGLARPYGKLFAHYLPTASYSVHPYARPGIGSIEELDASTLDDVRAFHATYYRPDNAILVVSGNFNPAELNRWVDEYFASIRRPAGVSPRVTIAEPPRTAPRVFTVTEPNTPLPAVVLTYLLPPARSADSDALEVLEAVLSGGDNSRLKNALVRTRIATDADTSTDRKQSTGLLAVYAILAGGRTVPEAETVLRRELARLAREPVTAAELAEAKNELLTAALQERETVDGRAEALARGVLLEQDPRAADKSLAGIARVTARDIQRVAATYLADRGSVAIRYLPAAPGAAPGGDRIALAPGVVTSALTPPSNVQVVTPASEADRVSPPPPGKVIVTAAPTPVTARLANGLTVITVPRHNLPLVNASLIANAGAAADPGNMAGLHSLTAKLMTKGTRTRGATAVAAAVEALGGQLAAGAGREGMSLNLTVKVDQLPAALSVLSDLARNSVYSADELERARGQAIDEATVALQNPGALSRLAVTRALFGSGTYGSPADGSPQSLKAIDRAHVLATAARDIRPDNSVLVLSGDITPAQARLLADAAFGRWAAPATAGAALAVLPASGDAPLRGKVVLVDMPGAAQAAVAVARETAPRTDPQFYPTLVANAVLGGGYSARLNKEIRIKRGLSYGAGSTLRAERRDGSVAVAVQTKNPSAPEVLQIILDEMRRLGAEPIPAAEMGTRQANLAGNFGRQMESVSGLGSIVAGYVQQGIAPDEIGRYASLVQAVTPASAGAAAKARLAPDGVTVVIVGDSKLFADAIRKSVGDVIVIPIGAVQLDSATLR